MLLILRDQLLFNLLGMQITNTENLLGNQTFLHIFVAMMLWTQLGK